MGAKSLKDIARKGLHVLTVVVDGVTGLLTAQLGDAVKQQTTSSECEVYGPSGVLGIPSKPDAGSGAAEVIVITNSGHDAIVGVRDARWAALLQIIGLDYGETLVFSPAGGGYVVFRKDKSVQMFNGDRSSFIKLNADGTCVMGDDNAVAVARGDLVFAELGKIATGISGVGGVYTPPANASLISTSKGKIT